MQQATVRRGALPAAAQRSATTFAAPCPSSLIRQCLRGCSRPRGLRVVTPCNARGPSGGDDPSASSTVAAAVAAAAPAPPPAASDSSSPGPKDPPTGAQASTSTSASAAAGVSVPPQRGAADGSAGATSAASRAASRALRLLRQLLLDPTLAAFVVGGAVMSAAVFSWATGSALRRSQPYQFTILFSEASKLGAGTQVRMQGVQVGTIKRVAVTTEAVAALAEVSDAANVIPCASRFDINQYGLLADAFVDITPPAEGCDLRGAHGPHHPHCAAEGAIVCHGSKVQGSLGASFDYLMKFYLAQQDSTRTPDAGGV